MKFLRLLVIVLFVVMLGIALRVFPVEAQPGNLKQIVPGVWFREGEIKELGHCNNVIIEMKDYLIVVDANFPSGARLVLSGARKVSSKPVKYVFDTHHHGDHVYGNPVWTKLGATTIAYVGVAEEMKRYEPQRWQQTVKGRKDVAELNLPAPEPPRRTFKRSPYVINDGARRVELHFFGWAHTRGDAFAYLPKEKVLCTGDVIVNGPYNYLGDGNVGNWPNVIRAAQKLDVEHVLPGHGGPAGKDLMEGQAQYFTELYNAVKSAVAQGKKLEDIVAMQEGKPVSTSIQLSDGVKNWVGDGFAGQVRDTYDEITQGKPLGDLPHR